MITKFIKDNFYFNRSLTGRGVEKTLNYIKQQNNKLKILNFKSGKKVFDWKIPKIWEVHHAFFEDYKGKKYCDFKKNNLHLVGYSISKRGWVTRKKLLRKIYTHQIKKAIPYITSYYKKDWGFCASKNEVIKLKDKKYKVNIKTSFKNGNLKIGEYFIKGKTDYEIFFSTYICHPSMANNELSGPAIQNELIKYLKNKKNNFSYRFVFLPETIGSIAYLSLNYKKLKAKVVSGFNLTCLGDKGPFSMVSSRYGTTLSDTIAKNELFKKKKFKIHNFLYRGSDERQYCSQGIDLPIVTLCRSKFGTFKEYHTSLDDLNFVNEASLIDSFKFIKKIIQNLEKRIYPFIGDIKKINLYPSAAFPCEPFLTKYKLMSGLTAKNNYNQIQNILNVFTYSDGKNSIFQIAHLTKLSLNKVIKILLILKKKKIIL